MAYPYQTALLAYGASLKGYWPLENASGVAQVGSNLTPQNSPGSAAGMVYGSAGATSLNGTTQRFDGSHQANMEFVGVPFTLLAWLRPSASASFPGDHNFMAQRDNTSPNGGWQVYRGYPAGDRTQIVFDGGTPGEDEPFADGMFASNTVVFAAYSFDGSVIRFYKNGVLLDTKTPTQSIASSGTAIFRVGSNGDGFNLYMGDVCEVAALSVALTAPNLAALYAAAQTPATGLFLPQSMVVR